MSKKRRQHSSEFKFKIALEAAKGTKTVAEVASEAGIHPNQISQWKSQLLDEGATTGLCASLSSGKPSCTSRSGA